mgnify:FL=1
MNPIAFSTLGCPTWDLDRILTAATEYGYDALELRGYLTEMDLPKADPFTPENRDETARRIADAGLAVCCVSSSGIVAKANLDHVKEHAELAAALHCPFVRVFGGQLPADVPHAQAVEDAAKTLRAFGDAAQAAGTKIVLETHDSFSTGAAVAELLAAADHPAVFALWDLHHPYRQGEAIEDTHRYLAGKLAYLHIKDGKDGTYTLLGEGDIPTFPMLDLILKDGAYTGPISVEWEKRWKPEIADPDVALPQYARALRDYRSARA